jgi:hypothetical protein
MNLATKAGFPRVEKAYPSMALGTAEATPLQVATAYTMFANLGERVLPSPIARVTTGDGRTVNEPAPDKKTVIRPDVAYVMDDIMKDIVNKGTAAELRAWGFQNVAGRIGIAGKTGTSRDGWFAGFTPELVCVVYVGFDDNADLGMKGSDSAMPIWADFMRAALDLHPEWNGDWQMPPSVKKAEIDIRTGSLIRELSNEEAENVKAQQDAIKKKSNSNSNPDPNAESPELSDIYVTDVPLEFRRVELFIYGTLPTKALLPTDGDLSGATKPTPSPTPFTTWQEEGATGPTTTVPREERNNADLESKITVMICPLSGMRATINCPNKEAKIFTQRHEPQDFCNLHRGQ